MAVLILALFLPLVPARAELIMNEAEASTLDHEQQALRDVKIYLKLMSERSHDPTAFDRHHPFYGRLMTDRAFFESWFDRWQSHPARFEYWHPYLSRFLDGEARSTGSVTPSISTVLVPPAGQEPSLPPPPLPPGGLSSPPTSLVPEPGSFLVFLAGAGLILLAQKGRKLA
jgi:hypothetical protein